MFTIRKLDEVPKTIALILLDPESSARAEITGGLIPAASCPSQCMEIAGAVILLFWSFFFAFYFFLIGGQVLYNIVLASATHQHELATGIHMSSTCF